MGPLAASTVLAETKAMPEPKTILLVDDESHIRAFLHRYLERMGYQVIEAESGPVACKLLLDSATEIGLVVVDENMPKMTGTELEHWIRQQQALRALPVLVLKGNVTNLVEAIRRSHLP